MELFILNPETKLPEIHPSTLTIECFRQLWKRLRPIDGDRDGRKKLYNTKELGYIYFTGKYDSRFKTLSPVDRDKKIKDLIGLSEDWIPDDLVKQCLDVWIDAQITPSLEFVSSLEGTISALAKYMNTVKTAISAGNLATVYPSTIKEIIAIIKDSPNLVNDIAKAKTVLQNEQEALATGRKGRKFNKYEMTN